MLDSPRAAPVGDTASATVVAMVRVLRSLNARLREDVTDAATYATLHQIGVSGPVRLTDLAGALHLDHSTVSRHVTRLVERGAVVRSPDPEDGRAARLSLTATGQGILGNALRRRAALVEAATAGWSTARRAELVRLLDDLADSLAPACPDHQEPHP